MSFLDRFQHKIATVTAHGHLKKADGSEEIRVGPPKQRKPAPQQHKPSNQVSLSAQQLQRAPPTGKHQQPTQQPQIPALPTSGRKQQPQPQQSGRQASHASPTNSPRNKSGRDSYASDHYGDNNHQYNPYQHPGAVDPYYYEQASIPGRLKEDSNYDHQYSGRHNPQHQSQQQLVSPSKSPSPTRNKAPSPSRFPPDPVDEKEVLSPKEINEARVQSDQDQLVFSRKARPVHYEPCKLSQYKKEKPDGYYELGKLQPDLNSEELVQKRANQERIKAFSKNLRQINKAAPAKKPAADSNNESPSKAKSSRAKALAFAKHVPKPRQTRPNSGESINGGGTRRIGSGLANPPARPINSVLDDDSDEDEMSSELQQLQMRHQASRAQVDALIKS